MSICSAFVLQFRVLVVLVLRRSGCTGMGSLVAKASFPFVVQDCKITEMKFNLRIFVDFDMGTCYGGGGGALLQPFLKSRSGTFATSGFPHDCVGSGVLNPTEACQFVGLFLCWFTKPDSLHCAMNLKTKTVESIDHAPTFGCFRRCGSGRSQRQQAKQEEHHPCFDLEAAGGGCVGCAVCCVEACNMGARTVCSKWLRYGGIVKNNKKGEREKGPWIQIDLDCNYFDYF